jgi:hypothetical protein
VTFIQVIQNMKITGMQYVERISVLTQCYGC